MSEAAPARDIYGWPAVIQPFRPRFGGWARWPVDISRWPTKPYVIERYWNREHETQVMTAIESVEAEGLGTPRRIEYHLSVSGLRYLAPAPYRCSASRARWALQQFGFDGWTEDNHAPDGKVRNFWRPVEDAKAGQVCACIDDEPAIRAMGGDYVWRGL